MLLLGALGVAAGLVGVGLAMDAAGLGADWDSCSVDAGWTCSVMRVPERHAVPGESVPLAYAVHEASDPAAGAPRRTLVYLVGGPGYGGIDDGRAVIAALDPRVVEAFDIVTFDPRGTGRSAARDCPDAGAKLWDAPVPDDAALRRFVADCVAEARVSDLDLRSFATAETVEDLEAIRERLGVERLTVYGSSYGTVVAQAYAAVHPDRVDALVLDAPVDRSIPPATLWTDAARGGRMVLAATLGECEFDPACADAMPDARGAWSRLRGALDRHGSIVGEIRDDAGDARVVTLTPKGLGLITWDALYAPTSRMALLRAIAAWDRGDAAPLLRIMGMYDAAASGAFSYYATWCADVRVTPEGPPDIAAYRAAAETAGLRDPAEASIADALAPCVHWPAQPEAWGPPAEDHTVPTLVLAGTTDPVTRIDAARAIAARHPQAWLVETLNGGHGSMGGMCAMDHLARFILDGRRPATRRVTCEVAAMDPFVPLAADRAESPRDIVEGLVLEVAGTPEVLYWDGFDEVRVGCAGGGTVTLLDDDGSWLKRVEFNGCVWTGATALSGSGSIDLVSLAADLRLEGPRGSLTLESRGDGSRVTGTWDGKPVLGD